MSILQACVLSIIEGITEFLPVSSTGHLILASKFLGIVPTDFIKSFEIFIQLGAIMAVVTLYAKKVVSRPSLIPPVLIAFLPTGLLGVTLYKMIKDHLLNSDLLVVVMLASVGALLILLEFYFKKHPRSHTVPVTGLTPLRLIAIGLFQSVSMVPGVSRAAATITGGMFLGLSREDAVEFSFLLAVPTMAAATGLDLVKNAHAFSRPELGLLGLGFLVSWITALLVIRVFVRLVKRTTFVPFGMYRILLAAVYFMFVYL